MHFQPEPTGLTAPRATERLTSCAQRNHYCPNYQGCLNLAVRRDWADWTCSRCELKNARGAMDVKDFAHMRPRGPIDL